jgi:hypothetical protein
MTSASSVLAAVFAIWIGLTPAAAQTPPDVSPPTWEVEVHGGFAAARSSREWTGAIPPRPGVIAVPEIGRNAVLVDSWFFGRGNTAFWQAQAPGPGRPEIASLDPAITNPAATWGPGLDLGLRLRRRVTDRFSAELSVTYAAGGYRLSSDARSTLEHSRDTFQTAWLAFFARHPETYVAAAVTSESSTSGGPAGRLVTTGSLVVDLTPGAITTPYLTVGAGVAASPGATLTATLSGRYRFLAHGVAPIDETDSVTVRFSPGGPTMLLVMGGGLKRELSSRWGITGDVRMWLGADRRITTISTAATTVAAAPAGAAIDTRNLPVVFSTRPDLRTSLSGDGVTDFETMRLSGPRVQFSMAVGLVRRF